MTAKLRLVVDNENFDPTEEELARAAPAKRSKCFKCGLRSRLEILDPSSLRAVLGELEQALRSSRELSRVKTERLFIAHLNLVRAQRSFYCALCVASVTSFAESLLEALSG